MRKILVIAVILFVCGTAWGQNINKIINAPEVDRLERVLSSDEMEGRKTFTASIDKAADFIAGEFKKSGLQFFGGLKDFKQPFTMLKTKFISASGSMDHQPVETSDIIAVTTNADLTFNEQSGYTKVIFDTSVNLLAEASRLIKGNKRTLVLVNRFHAKNFFKLKRFKGQTFDPIEGVIFILTDSNPETYSFEIKHDISVSALANVIGVLPGKSRKNEYVIFSGHYDHLGIGKANAAGDSIYNGANDDAAGTAAVMMLANYFSSLKTNERTLIFVAFTAEEIGGFGSQYFSRQIDPKSAVAMFNIEMIGTESKWGKNSAYITGYEKSNFGTILQANLAGSNFKFEADPYVTQNLFYRSDNATLAALGVPAHTINTSKMDSEPYYHTQEDEIETLDMTNMAEIIKAIALSSKGIVAGTDTPSRVALERK